MSTVVYSSLCLGISVFTCPHVPGHQNRATGIITSVTSPALPSTFSCPLMSRFQIIFHIVLIFVVSHFKKRFDLFILKKRASGRRDKGREKSQAGSTQCAEPDVWLSPTGLRLWPQLKVRVSLLTD